MRENTTSFRYMRNQDSAYQYGSAAPAYEPRRRKPGEYERPEQRKSHKRDSRFSFKGLFFVIPAFAFLAIVMVHYVTVQSELTSTVKTVAGKEIALSKLTSDNDELYSRIINSVDLDDIEAIAKGELGMTYAGEGQIITYTSVANDYMRKVDSSK